MFRDSYLRMAGMMAFAFGGWELGSFITRLTGASSQIEWIAPLLAAIGGFAITPYITTHPWRWALKRLKQTPVHTFVAAAVGLLVGLIASALLALPLSLLPGLWGNITPIVVAVPLCYLSVSLLMMRDRDLLEFLRPGSLVSKGTPSSEQIVLDTSAIIDGRIADISQTGFLQGTLLIPRFILTELQQIADSPDSMRRNRGRRGLDMLSKLQKESDVPVQVSEVDFGDTHEVDAKLVKLAKSLRCPIITNDFNLNRVAELQGVRVLNINELANTVKPVVLPGEEMTIRIIQEGREAGQGIGFLDDGTMVVVEGGKRYLNSDLDITVTRVLQTAAGRMIFAQPQDGQRNERGKR